MWLLLQGAVSSLAELAPGTHFKQVLGDTSVSGERYTYLCGFKIFIIRVICLFSFTPLESAHEFLVANSTRAARLIVKKKLISIQTCSDLISKW